MEFLLLKKQKKSFIRNLHIISYKNKKTQKQKNLNKLLENQTNGLEDYMDLYMNYTSQSYGAVYEEYRINRCQFKQMLISIIILILFMIIGICANRSVQKSAAQKRQEQQQERYVDGLKKYKKVTNRIDKNIIKNIKNAQKTSKFFGAFFELNSCILSKDDYNND